MRQSVLIEVDEIYAVQFTKFIQRIPCIIDLHHDLTQFHIFTSIYGKCYTPLLEISGLSILTRFQLPVIEEIAEKLDPD